MQGYTTNKIKRNSPIISNRYDKDVQATANKVITIQSINLAQYSKMNEAVQYYTRGVVLVLAGLLTSAITYPLSVKIAKKVFRLKSFLNIHMAVLPMMMNANAFVLGVTQGFINLHLLKDNYD